MKFLDMPPLLVYLELTMIVMASCAFVLACFLIRAARRPLDMPKQPSHNMPSTPLTREKPKRPRELTRV